MLSMRREGITQICTFWNLAVLYESGASVAMSNRDTNYLVRLAVRVMNMAPAVICIVDQNQYVI